MLTNHKPELGLSFLFCFWVHSNGRRKLKDTVCLSSSWTVWCLHTEWCTLMFAYTSHSHQLFLQSGDVISRLSQAQECWQTPPRSTSHDLHTIPEAPVKLNLADTKSLAFWNWKRQVASRRCWIPRGSRQMKTRPKHLNIALICITGLMSHLETPEKDKAAVGRGGGRRASLGGVALAATQGFPCSSV